jgi:hypothetical protein
MERKEIFLEDACSQLEERNVNTFKFPDRLITVPVYSAVVIKELEIFDLLTP